MSLGSSLWKHLGKALISGFKSTYLSLLRLCNDDLAGLDGGGRLSAGLLGLLCALHLHSSWLLGQSEVVLYRLSGSYRLTHLLLETTHTPRIKHLDCIKSA